MKLKKTILSGGLFLVFFFITPNLAFATVTGQQVYTANGTYSWTAPTGVTSVSVVMVGKGSSGTGSGDGPGGGGGALCYKNNITVVPTTSYAVTVGTSGVSSIVINGTTYSAASGASPTGGSTLVNCDGGGSGGNGGSASGGGAGGYSGNGGAAAALGVASGAGSGGGGSGGSGGNNITGGGVGILGSGTSGASVTSAQGLGGSGGGNGTTGIGGAYGGGGSNGSGGLGAIRPGGPGAVRIIWPGDARQFPSTRTADEGFVCGDTVNIIYNNSPVSYGTVTGADGKCWMDRNLGATQVAVSSTDTASYGHLFQWGRLADGHQVTWSGTTGTQSTGDVPGNANFIIGFADWRSTQNDNLWGDVGRTNNVCSAGWHVPSQTEWGALITAAGITNSATAYSSTLKLPVAGYRLYSAGALTNQDSSGGYWSSSPSGVNALAFFFTSAVVYPADLNGRAIGFSVRCIHDVVVASVTWNSATGGTSSGVSTCNVGDTVVPTCTPSTGYSTASCASFTCSTSNSFTPSFSINSYTVTFNTNGGDGGATAAQSLVYNTPTALTSNGFTRTGYSFVNWNTAANNSGTAYANNASYTIGTAGVTLYAQWSLDAYALTIPASGGNGSGSYGGTAAGDITPGAAVSITATPAASSNFTSWTATGAAATACNGSATSPCAFTMNSAASVTANYTLKTYTLTYTAGANGTLSTGTGTADTGASSPGTMADDATVGNLTWSNPNNAKVNDSVYATIGPNLGTVEAGVTIRDYAVKIVKSDGSIGTTNKGFTATAWPTTKAYVSYGSSSDLWGETWTPTDINNANFGVVSSVVQTGTSHYLKATNFGFTIPTSATINGILIEIEKFTNTTASVLEGSYIQTPSGDKKIEDIKIGDKVYSFNEKTNKTEEDTVIKTEDHGQELRPIYSIYVDGLEEPMKVTGNHRIYTKGIYKPAEEIKVGDVLLDIQLKDRVVTKIVIEPTNRKVFDIEIENNHNFFVENILVHNIGTQTYAHVDHIRITAYYTSSGSGSSTSQTVNYGASGSAVTAVPNTGYSFSSWSDAVATAGRIDTNITANNSVTANFSINSYTITFDSAGGSAVTAITQNYATAISAPTAPTKAGYTFAGWLPAVPATMGLSQTSVAQWSVNSYTVTFDTNTGDGGSTAAQSLVYNAPTALTSNGFTKTGYSFTSWNTAADGSGTTYANNASYTIGAAGVTLYAQWSINSQSALSITSTSVTYPNTLALTTSGGSGSGGVSYVVNSGSCTVSGSTLTPTGAGSCSVTATKAGDGVTYLNSVSSSPTTITINSASQTASINTASAVYTGSAISRAVTCSGGGTATPATVSGTNIGTYTATISCAASGNYATTSGLNPGSFSITVAPQTASLSPTSVIYNGGSQSATVICSGGGVPTPATVSGTNIGTYTATISCAASGNYVATGSLNPGNFSITATAQSGSLTQTTDTDFNGGTQSSTIVIGSGIGGSVSLRRSP